MKIIKNNVEMNQAQKDTAFSLVNSNGGLDIVKTATLSNIKGHNVIFLTLECNGYSAWYEIGAKGAIKARKVS